MIAKVVVVALLVAVCSAQVTIPSSVWTPSNGVSGVFQWVPYPFNMTAQTIGSCCATNYTVTATYFVNSTSFNLNVVSGGSGNCSFDPLPITFGNLTQGPDAYAFIANKVYFGSILTGDSACFRIETLSANATYVNIWVNIGNTTCPSINVTDPYCTGETNVVVGQYLATVTTPTPTPTTVTTTSSLTTTASPTGTTTRSPTPTPTSSASAVVASLISFVLAVAMLL
jgi:hypothetical protein